jgi:hypothetical protein
MDPMSFLREGDDGKLAIRVAVMRKAWELRAEERHHEMKIMAGWMGVTFKE